MFIPAALIAATMLWATVAALSAALYWTALTGCAPVPFQKVNVTVLPAPSVSWNCEPEVILMPAGATR